MNALWFSRHAATPEQFFEIGSKGYNLIMAPQSVLGDIQSVDDLEKIEDEMNEIIKENNISAIFGVYPTPILGKLYDDAVLAILNGNLTENFVTCFASWNIKRSEIGGALTFEHAGFLPVGEWLCI